MKKHILLSLFIMLFITACDPESPPSDTVSFELIEGYDTVEIHSEWVDEGVEYKDGSNTLIIYTEDELDTGILGLKQVTYHYQTETKTYNLTRHIMVIDTKKPVITLHENIDTIYQDANWTDSGVTVTDNSLEELIPVISGEVDTSTPGEYIITYQATDSSGNQQTMYRVVSVLPKK